MSQNSKIWLSSPHMGGGEQKYVQEAFDTNWVAPLGPNVDEFEKLISSYLGIAQTAALASGTSALHLGLILLGVQSGDYVICQSLTFSASANPIVYQGAIPVFVDSEKDTWNMDPSSLEDAIKSCMGIEVSSKEGKNHTFSVFKKPKAIIPVHLYGMPAKMDEIMAIAQKYDIPILEDAAEALGSKYNGKFCGTFGNLSALSFNGNKIITTSGGGAIVSDNPDLISKARFLSTQARDNAPHFQHSHIGYNYRMSNVLAGIGRGQVEVLENRVLARRKNHDRYVDFFKNIEGIKVQMEPDSIYYSNFWLTSVQVDSALTGGITREDIRVKLAEENIEARPLWKPMHIQPIFEHAPYFGGDISEDLFKNGLCLPSGSNLTDSDFDRIFSKLTQILN